MKNIKDRIISKCGGVKAVAEMCGVTAGAVSQWELIPARHQLTLLREAKARGIDLSADDFAGTSAPVRRPAPGKPQLVEKDEDEQAPQGEEMLGAEMIVKALLGEDV